MDFDQSVDAAADSNFATLLAFEAGREFSLYAFPQNLSSSFGTSVDGMEGQVPMTVNERSETLMDKSLGDDFTTELKARAQQYVLDNIINPTRSDFIFTENAMLIGASLAIEFNLAELVNKT